MEVRKIEDLSYEWYKITDLVIRFENIDFGKLQNLFRETYNVIEEFSKEKFVPKQMSGLLLEMNEFDWWVGSLDDTPLHEFYQEIGSLISALKKYFLTRDYNVEAIIDTIESMEEGYIKQVKSWYE